MATKRSGILLEPDRSLLDKNLLFTSLSKSLLADLTKHCLNFFKEPENEIEDILLHRVQEKNDLPWTTVKPIPGFCIKLRKISPRKEKVFINICKTDQIPPPEEKAESELMEILNSDEPSTYRVPMSVGEERPDFDKSGNPCTVFDIVVNSEFYKKVESSQLFRRFLIAATLEALEDKYNVELEKEDFAVLKGRQCKGGMTEQRIQIRSKPLVEMIPSQDSSKICGRKLDSKAGADVLKKPLITEIKSSEMGTKQENKSSPKTKEPPYIIKWKVVECESDGKVMVAEILLRDLLIPKEIEVDVGEDRILLQTKRSNYFLDIFLPHLISQEKTTAKFSSESKRKQLLHILTPLSCMVEEDTGKDMDVIKALGLPLTCTLSLSQPYILSPPEKN